MAPMHSNGPDSTCAPHTPSRFVLAGTERQYERSRPFVLQHQALDVTLLVESASIDARATLSFSRVDPRATVLVLDAVGFELDAVRFLDDESASDATYAYDGDELSITIPLEVAEGRIEIDYRARPRRGLYFLAPDETVQDRPRQVWSQCQDEDARHWFPCHDAPNMKLTSELTVTVPADWVALSNGTCVEQEIGADDGKVSIFHFRLDRPHPSYLVTLAAGHFSILEDRPASLESGRRIPIRYYVPEGREAEAWRSLSDTPKMVELFSKLTGLEYPFDSYTQVVVHDFIFGGMENTTATTLYEHVLLDERAAIDVDSRSLVAHELAHQWFGDTLTCRDWHEAWLNEGFATYFEHLEREDRLGRDDYDWSILRAFDGYMAEFNESYDRPIVCRDYIAPIDLFDRHLYEKGSLVLHMLRRKLGDDVFWSAIREYARSNADQIVETVQLQRTCEKVSGQSLDRFFDDWIYRSGHPELTVSASYESGRLIVTLKQEPKGSRPEPFAVPFEIRIQTQDRGWVNLRRESTQLVESIVITLEQRPLAIAFDPELRITAPIKLEFGFDWLKGVLQSDASVRSRMLAAAALRFRQDKPSLELLRDILTDSSQPYMLRVECARSLGKTRAPETVSHLVAAVDADRAEVRRAVATALGQFRHNAVVAPLLGLAEGDPSYLVVAEAYRALGRSCQPEAKQALLGALGSPSWADVVRSGVIDGLTELRDKELLPTIYDQTHYGTPSRGRRAAALALGKLGSDRETRIKLELLLDDPDPHLRSDVVEALLELGQLDAQRALSARLEVEADTRVQRRLREALRDLGGRDASTTKRLNDDLVALKTKVAELETKVARMEPTPPQDDAASKPAAKATQRKTSSSAASARSKPKASSSTRRAKAKAATKPAKTRGAKQQRRGRG